MTVWGRIWNIPGSLDEELRSSSSLTKEDLRKLQVLQNKCLRLVTNSDYKTTTKVLLQKTNSLSVHQRMAQLNLSQVYSIYHNQLPAYHYDRLFTRLRNVPGTMNGFTANRVEFNLSLARTHFFYQASRLWTALPNQIKISRNKATFKKRCKSWVQANIMMKP